MIKDLIIKARSFRKFEQNRAIENDILKDIVNQARLTASARNIQPLKYSSTTSVDMCNKIFSTLGWAGYLKDGAPKEGERPTGYIVIFNDTNIAPSSMWDQGIVIQTISMSLAEKGLGACTIASVNREKFKELINVPENLEIALVMAVGYPNENVVITDMEDNQYKYYRDENGTHYVPKRVFNEIYLELE